MAGSTTLVDRVKIVSLSSGTGPFQLGAAVQAYRGTEALQDGATYSYAVESGSTFETGKGVYLAASATLVRSPELSSNGNAPVPFGSNIQIAFTALADDFALTAAVNAAVEIATEVGAAAGAAAGSQAAISKAEASALGVASGASNMGSFTGGLVPASQSTKSILQQLIDAILADRSKVIWLKDCGAVGDGTALDNDAFERAQDKLPDGGQIWASPGMILNFNPPPRTRPGISLRGFYIPVEFGDLQTPDQAASSIILPAHNTGMQRDRGSEVTGFLIWRKGLTRPTSAADATTQLAQFAGTAMTAIGPDTRTHGNLFIGFAKPMVSAGQERTFFADNKFDTNGGGYELSQCFDISWIYRNHKWPFYTVHRSWTTDALLTRTGKAFWMFDVADFAHFNGNFDYGTAIGVEIEDVAAVTVLDNKFDHPISQAAGKVGVWTKGNCNNVQITGNHVDSHEVNYRLGHTSGFVTLGPNTAGQCSGSQYQFGPLSSGAAAILTARGSCIAPFHFVPGVGRWTITLAAGDVSPSSGNAFLFEEADRPNITIGMFVSNGGVIDNFNQGTAAVPTLRCKEDSTSGFYELPSGQLGASTLGKLALLINSDLNAVNYPVVSPSIAGEAVVFGAEGSQTNIDTAIVPKGTGRVRFGAYQAGAITATGWVEIKDIGGTVRRVLVG